jgi:hypothetical protein
MSDLLKVNVNDHTEKKNNLTYLSWAWAWAEVLKADPEATWEPVEYPAANGTLVPCLYVGDGTALVKTKVTIKGKTRSCVLPVMNHRNQAIKNPDAFAINTAIMRCMTKAISMHGLGLYIYAGEDLPEGEDNPPDPIPKSFRSSPTMGAMDEIEDEDRRVYLEMLASVVIAKVKAGEVAFAYQKIEAEKFDDSEKTALWSLLDSKTRSAIKKHIVSLSTTQEVPA